MKDGIYYAALFIKAALAARDECMLGPRDGNLGVPPDVLFKHVGMMYATVVRDALERAGLPPELRQQTMLSLEGAFQSTEEALRNKLKVLGDLGAVPARETKV